jgi:aminotransferase
MKVIVDKAKRLWRIPQPALGPMRFAAKRLKSRGVDLIDLGSTIAEIPGFVSRSMGGTATLLKSISADDRLLAKLKTRIVEKYSSLSQVNINPEKEIVITPGTEFTTSLLTLSILDHGDVASFPDPGMQFYRTAICLADAAPAAYSLVERNDYIPNIASLMEPPKKKLKMLFINYPHNPTGAQADYYFFRDMIKSIRYENILIAADSSYVRPGDSDAVSILQIKGSRKKAIELYSFSVAFGIEGLGFAVGHRDVVSILENLLQSLGYFPDVYRVEMATKALENADRIFEESTESIKRRRDMASLSLKELGWRLRSGGSVPFIWARPPARSSSLAFARRLVTKAGVRLAPGSDFGEGGEGWQRLTLHPDEKTLAEALERITRHSKIWQRKYKPKR